MSNLYKAANYIEKKAEEESKTNKFLSFLSDSKLGRGAAQMAGISLGDKLLGAYGQNIDKFVGSDAGAVQNLVNAALKNKSIGGVGEITDALKAQVGPGLFSSVTDQVNGLLKAKKQGLNWKLLLLPDDPGKLGDMVRKDYGLKEGIDKFIALHKSVKDKPGIVAHELGHALDAANGTNFSSTLRQISRKGMPAGWLPAAIAATFGASDKTVGVLGGLGSALALPTLRDEIVASGKGYKLLRGLGKGRLASLGAFAGVPTYLATAAMPFAPLGIKKLVEKLKGGGQKD